MSLRSENLFKSETKRIEVYVLKVRNALVMGIQEWDRDGQGFESFMMFGSWAPRVKHEPCARATQGAIQRFWDANIAEARKLVEDRVAFLNGAEIPA